MGEKPHARLQGLFDRFFFQHGDEWQIESFVEQRVQINDERFRIPDVTVVALRDNDDENIVRVAPLLCIEVLSSEDRMRKVQERLDDYSAMGVQAMWVIDPWRELAYAAGGDAVLREEKVMLTVLGTEIRIAVDEVFAELERLSKRSRVAG